MSSEADAPQGWLTKTLMDINNPFRKLFKEGTFASDMMNLGGGGLVVPGTWLKMMDYVTMEDGHKISSWDDVWKAARHFFTTDLNDNVEEFVWKYVAPAVASYYGGPYAAAGASYVGNKLSGETDKKALTSGIMSYGLGSVMEGVGAVSGGENSISNILSGEGSVSKVMSEPSVWEKLLSVVDKGFDYSKQQGTTEFGDNEFSYITGSIGDRLNPNGALAGLGVDMARKRQYQSALQDEAAKTKAQGDSQLSSLKDFLEGKVKFTPADQPGPTSMTVKSGANGEQIVTTTGTIPQRQQEPWSVNANPAKGTIDVFDKNGKPLPSDKWTPDIRTAYAAAQKALKNPAGELSVAGVAQPSNQATGAYSMGRTGSPVEDDTTQLANIIQRFQPAYDKSGNWILSEQQQRELAAMGIARQEDQVAFAKQMATLKQRMESGGESELDKALKLARLGRYGRENMIWVDNGNGTYSRVPANEPTQPGQAPPGVGLKSMLSAEQRVTLQKQGAAAEERILSGKHKGPKNTLISGVGIQDLNEYNVTQFELGNPNFFVVNAEDNQVVRLKPKAGVDVTTLAKDIEVIYKREITPSAALEAITSLPDFTNYFDLEFTDKKVRK